MNPAEQGHRPLPPRIDARTLQPRRGPSPRRDFRDRNDRGGWERSGPRPDFRGPPPGGPVGPGGYSGQPGMGPGSFAEARVQERMRRPIPFLWAPSPPPSPVRGAQVEKGDRRTSDGHRRGERRSRSRSRDRGGHAKRSRRDSSSEGSRSRSRDRRSRHRRSRSRSERRRHHSKRDRRADSRSRSRHRKSSHRRSRSRDRSRDRKKSHRRSRSRSTRRERSGARKSPSAPGPLSAPVVNASPAETRTEGHAMAGVPEERVLGPALPPPSASAISQADASDEEFGPSIPSQLLSNAVAAAEGDDRRAGFVPPPGHVDYGKALRPGEASAMAAFVQADKRIPRRGEVGWNGGEIDKMESLGYVMSGSRNKRMNEVRIRKENQVYSAEEKRALAQYNYEEKVAREMKVMEEFKQMLQQQAGIPPGPSAGPPN